MTSHPAGWTATELAQAAARGQLDLHYQPLVDLSSGRLRSVEALLRWRNGDRLVSPADFIPIAEESGLMLQLSDFVLHCACRQLRQWQLQDPAFAELSINVNVSGHDITHPAFVARVSRALWQKRQKSQA